jgi:hypothetical protein
MPFLVLMPPKSIMVQYKNQEYFSYIVVVDFIGGEYQKNHGHRHALKSLYPIHIFTGGCPTLKKINT